MKIAFKHIVILLLLAFVSIGSLLAQDAGWGEDGDLEDSYISIVKDLKIELPPASKNYEKVAPPPVIPFKKELSYADRDFDYDFQPILARLRAMTIKIDPLKKLYGNYVKLGMGNYVSPFAEVYLNNKRDKNIAYGAHVKHESSINGPIDKKNSGYNDNLLHMYAKSFNDNFVSRVRLDYDREMVHFYGYDDGLEVDNDSIKQVYNVLALEAMIKNNNKDALVDYRMVLKGYYMQDRFSSQEMGLDAELNSYYDYSDNLRIAIDGEAFVSQREDANIAVAERNMFKIRPTAEFVLDRFKVKAGVNVVYENDTIYDLGRIHTYPYLDAYTQFTDDVMLYARLDGDMEKNSLYGFVQENPYLGSDIDIHFTNNKLNLLAGFSGRVGQYLGFDAGVKVSTYANYALFMNDSTDLSHYIIRYDSGNTSVVNVFGELGYNNSEGFIVTFRGDYYAHSTDAISKAWHKPKYRMSLITNYNLRNKVLLSADATLLGGIEMDDYNPLTGDISLDNILNVNLSADYLFSKNFSMFLSFKNMTSKKYERFYRYPTRGFQAMLGATYSF